MDVGQPIEEGNVTLLNVHTHITKAVMEMIMKKRHAIITGVQVCTDPTQNKHISITYICNRNISVVFYRVKIITFGNQNDNYKTEGLCTHQLYTNSASYN